MICDEIYNKCEWSDIQSMARTLIALPAYNIYTSKEVIIMPLSFQRPSNSMFRRGTTTHNTTTEDNATIDSKIKEPSGLHDFLKFFPLDANSQTKKSAVPVQPLSEKRAAKPGTALAQHFAQHQRKQMEQPKGMHRQGQAHSPTPSHTPHSPQSAVEQFRRINKSLPDGVMYEPLDDETMQLLKNTKPEPHQHQHNNTSPTPQSAAEQFRRINKSLPDGVMYEPLDDETMKLLKNAKPESPTLSNSNIIPPTQQSTVEQPHQEHNTSSQPVSIETLKELAQNEFNAQIFYSSLQAPSDAIKTSLNIIAEDCNSRIQQLIAILTQHHNIIFAPEKKEINTTLPFKDAITLALTEESKSLLNLNKLLDLPENAPFERKIERIVSKKIINYQMLLSCMI